VQADIKGLALVLDCAFDDTLRADCDGLRLGQVIQNLVGNAVKFTAQGSVELRAAVRDGPDGDRLEIEVIDSGPGVPAPEQQHLFSAFTQGDAGRRAGQGAGLGLSIAARIVELMGGSLRLAASSDSGSVFAVAVPIELLPPARGEVAARADAA
jgi:two-component system sensor histidine kinase TorS